MHSLLSTLTYSIVVQTENSADVRLLRSQHRVLLFAHMWQTYQICSEQQQHMESDHLSVIRTPRSEFPSLSNSYAVKCDTNVIGVRPAKALTSPLILRRHSYMIELLAFIWPSSDICHLKEKMAIK